jgi:hypothetical protein
MSTKQIWEATLTDDPWEGLQAPTDASAINARRVDEAGRWDFYWGLDSDRKRALILRYSAEAAPRQPLPRFRGVEVITSSVRPNETPSLIIRLLDAALHDVFLELCRDIMDSTASGVSETEAVSITVARTWRWHHLVRGGSSGLLSREEQMGLIGELIVLERYLLPLFPTNEAIAAWRGPLGASKDFAIGDASIESKAHASARATVVLI